MAAIVRLFRFAFPAALSAGAILTMQAQSAFAIDWRQSGSQRCAVTGCGGSSGSSSSGSPTSPAPAVHQPSPAELQQRQVVALQQQGLAQFRAGKFLEALRLFELSLKLCVAADDIQNLKGDIGATHTRLGGIAYKRGDVEGALHHFELAQQYIPDNAANLENLAAARKDIAARKQARIDEQHEKAGAKNIQQSVQNFAQTLRAAPSPGGLDFDGLNSASSPAAGGKGGELDFAPVVSTGNRTASALSSGDPRVVDARDVPSGLSKPVENAIVGAYANRPPGVSERVRKGFQAVVDGDWKVAKAWFEEALQRDPGNPDLKRLVALADQTPQKRPQAAGSLLGSTAARHTLASLNEAAGKMSTAQVMKALEDIMAENILAQAPRTIK